MTRNGALRVALLGGVVSLASEDFTSDLIGADGFRQIFNHWWVTAIGAAIFLLGIYLFFAQSRNSN